MTKAEAGRLGGLATVRKYGPAYMAAIGRRGAARFFARYELQPSGTSRFAIVRKLDGKIVNYLDGNPFAKVQSGG